MFCKYCGKQVMEGAKFCAGCGKPVDPAGQGLKSERKAEEEKREKKGTKRGKTGLWIGALAAIFCIAAIVCIAVFGFRKKTVWVVSEHISYNKDGTVSYREKYSYDEEGMLISVKEFSGNTLTNKIDYSYEESRKGLKRIGKYSQTGGTARSEEILDENGNAIVVKYFNADGKCYSWTENEYDDEGHQLLLENCDSDGNLKNGIRWKYDEYGNLEETALYHDDRNAPYDYTKWKYKYDEKERPVSAVISQNGTQTKAEFTYSYDRKGRVKTREMRAGEEYVLLEYDEVGNILHQEGEGPDYNLDYNYEYDDAGNQTLCKIQMNDQVYWDYSALSACWRVRFY